MRPKMRRLILASTLLFSPVVYADVSANAVEAICSQTATPEICKVMIIQLEARSYMAGKMMQLCENGNAEACLHVDNYKDHQKLVVDTAEALIKKVAQEQ